MKRNVFGILLLTLVAACQAQAALVTAAISYQGSLDNHGGPVNGIYDFSFTLFDNATGGNAVGRSVTNSMVVVSNGVFRAILNFDDNTFDGTAYWIEIAVRPNGSDSFTILNPRQPVLATAYARYAPNAGTATKAISADSVAAANISGLISLAQLPAEVLTNNATNVTISGTFSGDGNGLTNLNLTNLTIGLAQLPAGVLTNQSTGVNISGVFSGDGNGLTNLNLTNLTIGLAQLPAGVLTNQSTNVNIGGVFSGDGNGLTNLNLTNLTIGLAQLPAGVLTNQSTNVNIGGVFSGDGNGLTNLNLTNLTIGLAQLPAGVLTNQSTGVNISGVFSGDGSGLTNLAATSIMASLGPTLQAATSQIASMATSPAFTVPRVLLPNEFTAVVGDRLQLFVRGMIEAQDPYSLPYEIVCTKGNFYPRYFDYTPTAADLGSQTLKVNLLNNQTVPIASAQTTLRIVSANRAPSSQVCVLCIGDSLTAVGQWPAEFYRRLTQTGGTPAGLGYANISFVGDHVMRDYPAQGYVGLGGWTWENYTNTSTAYANWITAVGNDKTSVDIGSTWADSATGNYWVLMQTNGDFLKIGQYQGSPHGPLTAASGTLTNISGGTHTTAIDFTATNGAILSPLNDTNGFSFKGAAASFGWPSISVVYVLLGWNDLWWWSGDNAAYATNNAAVQASAQAFINQLHSDYPSALVRIVGVEVPSPNGGLGYNFGANGTVATYYRVLRRVNGLNLAYQQLCDSPTNSAFCRFINLSCQFDSENNLPSIATPVNTRNATMENRGSNSVHPTTSGYNQIADACWRDFVRTFCQ